MSSKAASEENLQQLNEQIYKHSLELAVINKTLSLLRKLYQISLLTLDPDKLSEKISDTVRVDLNMEMVGIFTVLGDSKNLEPQPFSMSERFADVIRTEGIVWGKKQSIDGSKNAILNKVISEKKWQTAGSFEDVFKEWVELEKLKKLDTEGHIDTVLIYPLVTQDELIGLLMFGLNRGYDSLSDFEQEAISSLANVVAVALDKALIYDQLKIANEQLKALDKARAEFISIASHQLRTPPATIKWYLGAILSGDFGELSEELRAALSRTNVTNEAQISTIDDLLNASRIERGKLEFFFQDANIVPMVTALVEQLEPLAQMHKQHLAYRAPAEALPDIMMDGEKIRQVINNMIDNAIKYSKQGDIEVMIEHDEENITVKVKDTGKGMDKETQEALFKKYSRGSDSATHATGLGLGMYVAKVIVEQHNGRIWAESPGLGKGSTFAFSLPIKSKIGATTVDLVQKLG